MRTFTAILLCSVAFAGCVASQAEGGSKGLAPQTAAPAEFDDVTGAVQGLVTNDELAPIVDAQVGLQKTEIITTEMMAKTDPSGHFTLSRVPPGSHLLFIQALGYESAARKVDVAAGEISEVNIELIPLPSDEPFYVLDIRPAVIVAIMVKATPQCIYNIGGGGSLAKTCQGQRRSCDPGPNCEVNYDKLLSDNQEAGINWTTAVGEVTWKPQSGATGRGFLFDLTAPRAPRDANTGAIDQSHPKTFVKMQPKPPIVLKIDQSVLEERKIPPEDWCCPWFYRLFGGWCDIESAAGLNNCETTPDVGISYENKATVYMTWFFREPAPEGYSSLPDE